LYHLTAGGKTTWCGFAREIVHGAGLSTPVRPIRTSDYPTAAARPRNSLLDNAKLGKECGIALPDWRAQLREVLPQALR